MKYNNIILPDDIQGKGYFISMTGDNILEGRRIEKNNLSDEKTVITDKCNGSFDAIQKNGIIHIVTGDREGNILYVVLKKEEVIQEHIITSASDNNISFFDFHLFYYESKLILMYTATSDKKHILCFQTIEKNITNPVIVDVLYNKEEVFCSGNNRYISVYYFERETRTFGKKTYDFNQNFWSDFVPLFHKQETPSMIYVLEKNEKTYFCYKKGEELIFRSMEENKKPGNEKILTKQHTLNSESPIITENSEKIKLFWKNKSSVFYSEKSYNSESWIKIREMKLKTAVCRLREDNYASFDLFYISEDGLNFFSEKKLWKKKIDEESTQKADISNNREEIERKKMEIMKNLGISKNNNFSDFESEQMQTDAKPYIFSSDNKSIAENSINFKKNGETEILNELKQINKALQLLLISTKRTGKHSATNLKNKYPVKFSYKLHKK